MFEGRLGGLVIATASLSQINAIDFQQIRQGNKNALQTMEQSKIQFGVLDPIDLVQVKLTPPIFRGMSGDSASLLAAYSRSFQEDLSSMKLLSAETIQELQRKSQIIACQYGDNNRNLPKVQKSNENDLNVKGNNDVNINLVNSASTASSTQFE